MNDSFRYKYFDLNKWRTRNNKKLSREPSEYLALIYEAGAACGGSRCKIWLAPRKHYEIDDMMLEGARLFYWNSSKGYYCLPLQYRIVKGIAMVYPIDIWCKLRKMIDGTVEQITIERGTMGLEAMMEVMNDINNSCHFCGHGYIEDESLCKGDSRVYSISAYYKDDVFSIGRYSITFISLDCTFKNERVWGLLEDTMQTDCWERQQLSSWASNIYTGDARLNIGYVNAIGKREVLQIVLDKNFIKRVKYGATDEFLCIPPSWEIFDRIFSFVFGGY
jgi:hypothetical protein